MDQTNVHSANDWEHAELGDDSRKDKFLRLMGAKKKEHKGKIVIGDETNIHQHTKTDEEFRQIDKNLESAYNCGMEHDPGSATDGGHKGVGYADENKCEENKKEEEEPLDVKSANKWEKANLGDTGRRNKFLRLMGASKKEHTGKFIIGDKNEEDVNKRKIRPEKDLESDLERQYNQGLELRLTGAARRHKGLGFQEEPPKPKTDESNEKSETSQGSDGKTDDQLRNQDQRERDRDHRRDNYGRNEGSSRNYDRGEGRRENRDRSYDRRPDHDRHRDYRGGRSRWDNTSSGGNRDWNQDGGNQVQSPPNQQQASGNTQFNHPVQNTGGYNQFQGKFNQQVPTGYNQASFTQQLPPGYNQTANSPHQTAGYGQNTSVGSYLPHEILNQPPPPPPPTQPVEGNTVGGAHWQSSGNNLGQNAQSYSATQVQGGATYPPSAIGQSHQPFVHPQPQSTTQASHPKSLYFQKPTMSFVKSSDS